MSGLLQGSPQEYGVKYKFEVGSGLLPQKQMYRISLVDISCIDWHPGQCQLVP